MVQQKCYRHAQRKLFKSELRRCADKLKQISEKFLLMFFIIKMYLNK